MEQLWENWPLHMELGDEKNVLEQFHRSDDDEFLREILQQPALRAECEGQSLVNATTADGSGLLSNKIAGSDRLRPRTCILSFDNSMVIPAAPEPFIGYQRNSSQGTPSSKTNSPFSSKKRTLEILNFEPNPRASQGGKKARSDSQTLSHIMAERKRRKELSEKFIALSATIPGLHKLDKTSIVRGTINYVKQLQERVTELEQQRNKRGKDSMTSLKKTYLCANEVTTSSGTNFDDCCELLPDVKARVLENEVLIEIHCEKENGIELKILDLLQTILLCVTASSVLPYGNSTLSIVIIAQMGDAYRMTISDLVKNVMQVLGR